MRRVYLDHHAATPVDPRVRAALSSVEESAWANASSVHAEGRGSRAHLERAREQVAAAIVAVAADIVLTSGGTEACNLGVFGVLPATGRVHVITTEVEHPAVAEPLQQLERAGRITVTRLRVPCGQPPEAAELRAAITPDTRLCAVQWVNHETGTIFPCSEYAEVCRAAGVPLFVDATQAFGKLPLTVEALGADLIALASHKIGGTAGAGALWVQRKLALASVALGGGQERGRRAGTPDVRAAVGLGVACSLVPERLQQQVRIAGLRDRLESRLLALGAIRNAERGPRVGTASNVWWSGRRSDATVAALDLEGLAVSAGAACSSGTSEPSKVLRAMHPLEHARSETSIRFSFGPETDETAVEFAAECCRRISLRPPA
jgi:cysteine desulfurase